MLQLGDPGDLSINVAIADTVLRGPLILISRPREVELGQIQEIGSVVGRFDVEERRLPVFARLDDLGAFILVLATGDKAVASVGHVELLDGVAAFGSRSNHSPRLSVVSSEVEESFSEPDARAAAEITLTQRDEAGEDHDEVRCKVMWLQSVEVEEVAEEHADGESESTLKVSEEHDPLASACLRHGLGAGSAPQDLSGHLAGVH